VALKKLNALVVDDSGLMRKSVIQTLKKSKVAEFVFVEAADGEKALKKFSPGKFHVIFADWNMPNMTGIDLVHRIRKGKKDTKVKIIMVTSEKRVGKLQEALDKAGADGYVCKPFTVEDFQSKLTPILATVEVGGSWIKKLIGG
jgi:two-component system, chemotaxis family, chemotaxis protein CheY